jgi:hypothetical protein
MDKNWNRNGQYCCENNLLGTPKKQATPTAIVAMHADAQGYSAERRSSFPYRNHLAPRSKSSSLITSMIRAYAMLDASHFTLGLCVYISAHSMVTKENTHTPAFPLTLGAPTKSS